MNASTILNSQLGHLKVLSHEKIKTKPTLVGDPHIILDTAFSYTEHIVEMQWNKSSINEGVETRFKTSIAVALKAPLFAQNIFVVPETFIESEDPW